MNPSKNNRFLPLWLSLCVVIGVLIGAFITNHFSGNRLNIINSGSSRLSNLLHIIDDQYVDPVNINELVDKALPQILAELDPHSVYISAKDVQLATDDLKGSFSGIGVEFIIRNDTIQIQNVIKDGPAYKAGVLAGDKIVQVDNKPFVGKIVTNDEAMRRLKGPKNSKVVLGIVRYGEKDILKYSLIRGDIKMKSVSSVYMLNDTTGYIKIKNFGENTYAEMLSALQYLNFRGSENLIIDLRDNTGGYLDSAIRMLEEFLTKDQLIVYVEGRKSPRTEYRSKGKGSYQNLPLIVLINENSASAAEIFAGAIQDNDRGTIIGRRSFGKGLVQQQINFPDGSLIRLTIARYYTPSGRSIQKPFKPGENANYEQDIIDRYQHGEFFSKDSIKHNGPAYKTSKGRIVYGGGGITPDIFIPEDTTQLTSYYKEAIINGLILQYAYKFSDDNRSKLINLKDVEKLTKQLKKEDLVNKFANYAEQNGLRRRNNLINKSHDLIERHLISRIVYYLLDELALNKYLNSDDPMIKSAVEIFSQKKAFPERPNNTKGNKIKK